MARQSTSPVPFQRTQRPDQGTLYSSARAGVSVLAGAYPVLEGDSASGRVSIRGVMMDMPKPLSNSVVATVQAWFWPKTMDARFASYEEFMASRQGEPIKRHGQPDAPPLPFYRGIAADNAALLASDHVKTLGLHFPLLGSSSLVNIDLFDAYQSIWNFRAAAHSSHLELRDYFPTSGAADAEYWKFARAFWPQNRYSAVVADYEAALVQGQLALDVQAGIIPVEGLTIKNVGDVSDAGATISTYNHVATGQRDMQIKAGGSIDRLFSVRSDPSDGFVNPLKAVFGGERVITSLADIEVARTTQAFAKMRTAFAGNKISEYDNDSAIVSELMQGLSVPDTSFRRPWLLDSKMVEAGMVERHATDGASLDQSVTRGVFDVQLSINLPKQDLGGYIMVFIEMVPQRLYERQGDPALIFNTSNPRMHLPNALRDVQDPLPVDDVPNWLLDAKHTAPSALYGYQPKNDRWKRSYTRMGGRFFQATPGEPWNEARSALWMPEIVDPQFNRDHYLVPSPFPHDVFADTAGPAFEFQVNHSLVLTGLTQFGDALVEDNQDWQAVEDVE